MEVELTELPLLFKILTPLKDPVEEEWGIKELALLMPLRWILITIPPQTPIVTTLHLLKMEQQELPLILLMLSKRLT